MYVTDTAYSAITWAAKAASAKEAVDAKLHDILS